MRGVDAGKHPVGHAATADAVAHEGAVARAPRSGKRDAAFGAAQAGLGEQRTCEHGFGQRHGHDEVAAQFDECKGVAERQAGTAFGLGQQRVRKAGGFDGLPQRRGRGVAFASFNVAHGLQGASVGQHAAQGVDVDVVHRLLSLWCQRRPRPRAIIPRRMSRVPPRSENDGATCVT
ncbi:hypothetical protein D9M68_805560 [compost metagenome]